MELHDKVAQVLRRAESGEEFTITVTGRPVAGLGPAAKRRWASGAELRGVFETPAPQTPVADLEHRSSRCSAPT